MIPMSPIMPNLDDPLEIVKYIGHESRQQNGMVE